MNAEQIRAEVIAVAAREIASWESDPHPNSRHFACGEGVADALAAAGLLPVETVRRAAYAVLDTSDEHLVEQFVTGWREVPE